MDWRLIVAYLVLFSLPLLAGIAIGYLVRRGLDEARVALLSEDVRALRAAVERDGAWEARR